MNEAEQYLISSLEKLDSTYSEGLEKLHSIIRNLEKRVSTLEECYPELEALSNELERLLRQIDA